MTFDTKPLADNFACTSNAVLDAVIDTNRRVVDVVVAQADKVRDTVTERVTVDERITNALPTPAQAGGRYLEFVERAVALNREWNDRVVEMLRHDVPAAAATVTSTVSDTVAKTVPPKKAPAKKTAATRSPAKKTAAKRTAAKSTAARRKAAAKTTAAKTATN